MQKVLVIYSRLNTASQLFLKSLKEHVLSKQFRIFDEEKIALKSENNFLIIRPLHLPKLLNGPAIKLSIKKINPTHIIWVDVFYKTKTKARQTIFFSGDGLTEFQEKFNPDIPFNVITLSHLLKNEIIKYYPQINHSVAMPFGLEQYHPDYKKAEEFKSANCEGGEFFFCEVNDEDDEALLKVLKAFSVFKKWQLSSMKIVIKAKVSLSLNEKIKTYKFKDDVVFVLNEDALPLSYAVIITKTESNDAPFINAVLECNSACIVHENMVYEEWYGDAVYYCDMANEKSLGTAMVELYRNETLRNNLKKKSAPKAKALKNDQKNALNDFWMQAELS